MSLSRPGHQPLTSILGPKNDIPPLAAACMQRWALILSVYTYDNKFHSTNAHANADSLLRLPLSDLKPVGNTEDPTIFDVAQLDALPVQASVVASSTCSDPLLSKILAWLRTWWPTRVPEPFSQYWTRKYELTLSRQLYSLGNSSGSTPGVTVTDPYRASSWTSGHCKDEGCSTEPCLVVCQESELTTVQIVMKVLNSKDQRQSFLVYLRVVLFAAIQGTRRVPNWPFGAI